jgi:hypothetical protein
MIAVMASSWFRIVSSFAMMRAGLIRHSMRSNASRAASFPKKCASFRRKSRHFWDASEPVEATSVSYRGTAREE